MGECRGNPAFSGRLSRAPLPFLVRAAALKFFPAGKTFAAVADQNCRKQILIAPWAACINPYRIEGTSYPEAPTPTPANARRRSVAVPHRVLRLRGQNRRHSGRAAVPSGRRNTGEGSAGPWPAGDRLLPRWRRLSSVDAGDSLGQSAAYRSPARQGTR